MSSSKAGTKAAWEVVEDEEANGEPEAGGAESEAESESDLSPSDAEETSWCARRHTYAGRSATRPPCLTPSAGLAQGLMVLLAQGQ